jgi:putative ABC transport system permease protein
MFKNNLKIAWRSISKNRLYAFINIAGLTMGVTCCILIGLYITDELSFDKFHTKANRIVRVTMEYGDAGTHNNVATTGTKVGPQFKRIFPEIESFSRTFKNTTVVAWGTKMFEEKNVLYADKDFFKIFSFPLTEGDAASALNTKEKLVISEAMAKKYFGNEEPLGKILKIGSGRDMVVSAVAKNPPGNSQIQFDFVLPFGLITGNQDEQWFTANYITYLLLKDEKQVGALQQRITSYMKSGAIKTELGFTGADYLTHHIQPISQVHLHSSLDGFEPNGNIKYIYIIGLIAILILAIACVNYTNLATAQSAGRTGEIGIRKVLGAVKGQLFVQFIGESFLTTIIAIIPALVLSAALLPAFNSITGKHMTEAVLLEPQVLIPLILLAVVISFLAGSYPALILSGTAITKVLKSGFSFSTSGGGLRKSLIIFQFVISIFLIISTIIIMQQMRYIQHKNLGYDREHIVVLPADRVIHRNYEALKKEIGLIADVKDVTGAYEAPVFIRWGDGITAETGNEKKKIHVNAIPVDLNFSKTMGIQLIAGTDFTPSDFQLMDTSNNYKNFRYTFIINEAAAREIGWTPEEAIGKTITKGGDGTIKAVVKDFHFASLHEPIKPLVIFLDTSLVRNFFVKISGRNISATLDHMGALWKTRVTHRPFEYHFLDDDYNKLYQNEQRTAKVFGTATTLAILLACLGLFGLAAFSTIQRTKEIGIRKVLGAGLGNIVFLISKDFIILVSIAFIIASPMAWFAAHSWLQDFAYRVSIQWWVFVAAGIAGISIAILTVSFHSIKAGTANPVKSLRTE